MKFVFFSNSPSPSPSSKGDAPANETEKISQQRLKYEPSFEKIR